MQLQVRRNWRIEVSGYVKRCLHVDLRCVDIAGQVPLGYKARSNGKSPSPISAEMGFCVFLAQRSLFKQLLASAPLFCWAPPPIPDDLSIHATEYYRRYRGRQGPIAGCKS